MVVRSYFVMEGNMERDSELMKSRLIIEIDFNEEEELILKLNKICNELNIEMDRVIRKALINLYNNIEFVRSLKR
jgi:hypothetical protein